jgi:hypothetical protein
MVQLVEGPFVVMYVQIIRASKEKFIEQFSRGRSDFTIVEGQHDVEVEGSDLQWAGQKLSWFPLS